MNYKREQRIIMPAWAGMKRPITHSETEDGKIPEQHIERRPDGKIFPALAPARTEEFLFGEDRVRADACAEKFRIIIVMVIVRAFPDAGRSQHVQPKK